MDGCTCGAAASVSCFVLPVMAQRDKLHFIKSPETNKFHEVCHLSATPKKKNKKPAAQQSHHGRPARTVRVLTVQERRLRQRRIETGRPRADMQPVVSLEAKTAVKHIFLPWQNEIFASRHQDVNSVACIEDKCYVLTLAQYCR